MGAIDRVFRSRRPSQERPLAAIIAGLWRNGEQGIWLDASDLSTMFQDAAGALPVYAPGRGQVDPPVGRILDKSGRGNHATQATTTSRPVLSARYNLMTATEFPAGLADAPFRAGLVTAAALSGYAGALAFGYDSVNPSYAYKAGAPASTNVTLSVVVRMDDGLPPSFGATSGASNSDFALVLRNAAVNPTTYQVTALGGGLYRVSASSTSGAGSDSNGVVKYAGNSNRTFKVTAFDLRAVGDGVGLPPYQRVVDANTYDTAGFPLYLRFDGVDDFLQTASVDFSATDKMLVSAAVRKLSDVESGALVELSSTSGNPGTFVVLAPALANGADISVGLNGGIGGTPTYLRALGLPVPVSAVVSGMFDISQPLRESEISMRVNGAPPASAEWGNTSTHTGTGTFGNYPLYIGRRAGTSRPFNGRLYALLIRGAATSDATIIKVERYLNQKAKVFR